ncbi:MAG: lipocalin family protein [Bacteroidetes bacterium]|nr:lipocalin family protein [Bacteroidota bacterium]
MQPLYSIVSKRTLNRLAIIIVTMSGLMSCKSTRELPTVQSLDLVKYAGHWYEIARLPNSFKAGLESVTANYTIKKNGRITMEYNLRHQNKMVSVCNIQILLK